MAKHQSTWETLYLHHHFAPISPIVKKELLAIPFFGWGLASLRPIAIDRSNPMQALRDEIGRASCRERVWGSEEAGGWKNKKGRRTGRVCVSGYMRETR